jgi:valyl-tRNA synthetase
MPAELPKAYNPKETEDRIYKLWEESGFFNPDKLPGERKENYTVMIAPPNITGSLHMGHALENTVSDILIRHHRMRGFRTLWVPGVDHAGISAQSKVEKELQKQGVNKNELGREKFIEKMLEWREKYGDIILDQLKKLGCSLDWSRTAYTMNPGYQEAVKKAFEHYKEKGWIYKGKRIINWSVKDQTALSDLEIYYQEQKDTLWYVRYPLLENDGYVVVATTRPETMLGDTAVAVHPGDERYKKLIGKKVKLPITNREINIIADHSVEKEFGTGAVKVTPAHDFADFEIGQRNKLEQIEVINKFGKIVDAFPEFKGLKVLEARKAVAKRLEELGVIEKTEEFTHNVAYGERCQTVIEPLLSEQWFLKMEELAKHAIKAIESGEVAYHPERWKDVALTWLNNVRDWNISRQIWWGHQVPVAGETDVLDTWFSSALWPFAALGWPEETEDLKKYYPTQMITSARDILHLWISRMLFSGKEFTGRYPFNNIIIHGTILTKDGKRMSKSLGTGVDPLELIGKYGADATRFGLIYQSIGEQQDIKYGEEFIITGQKFANKLWNIARYVIGKAGDDWTVDKPAEDVQKIIYETNKHIRDYRFGEALYSLYHHIWHEFADKYIEQTKNDDSAETKQKLISALVTYIKLLHPFMPFVTEEIWSKLPVKDKKLLLIEEWPA